MYKIADVLLIIDQEDTDEEADQDHDHNFKSLLDRCRTQGIKLNEGKFRKFKRSDVSFIGHVMTKDGLSPDARKVELSKWSTQIMFQRNRDSLGW